MYQQNCYEIFDTYFLKYNPFFDIYDGKGNDLHGSLFGTGYGGANQPEDPRLGDVFVQIPCSLLEFYNGSMKTVKYVRQELSLDGHSVKTVAVSKTVAVRAGYSQNNTLTFKGEGHLMKKYHSDLVVNFVESNDALKLTQPKQHKLLQHYHRKGNDLIFTAKISLQNAINTEPVKVETLDGRLLSVPVDKIVGPKSVIRLEGEGMPVYESRKQEESQVARGDLFIKFDIAFPKKLTESQRERIQRILEAAQQ